MKVHKQLFITTLLLINYTFLVAQNQLSFSKIFGSHMVLQRDVTLTLSGKGAPNKALVLFFGDTKIQSKTNKVGLWKATVSPQKASNQAIEIKIIQKKDTLCLKNILIGDVWLASGQSNMEWFLSWMPKYETDIKTANYNQIRYFETKDSLSFSPISEIPSENKWQICTPQSAKNFSALAYFFAKELHEKYQIPIGIVVSSWGGTVAEAWMSKEKIEELGYFKEETQLRDNFAISYAKRNQIYNTAFENWCKKTEKVDSSFAFYQGVWKTESYDDQKWAEMSLPGNWENSSLPNYDGVVWFRKKFSLQNVPQKDSVLLSLSHIDDVDRVYINGNLVGSSPYLSMKRMYKFPSSLLKKGENQIAVWVYDSYGNGGIVGDIDSLYLKVDNQKIPLSGVWKYRTVQNTAEKDFPTLPQTSDSKNQPSVLYNSMIYPLKDFSFKGIIWYQGESNTTRAYQYKKLFQELILDWRKTFNQNELPFLFVQLASYHQEDKKTQESVWAELRQAQADALVLPKTGMATAIDLGDANDIHPPFKKELAYRLALSAYRVAYNEKIYDAGAILISVSKDESRVVIKVAGNTKPIYNHDKYGYINGFAIAGIDLKYEWAKAYLSGNEIWLQSDKVPNPKYIRYAWSDNPGKLSIYTSDGLPLLPFKTDKLPWSTQPK